MARHLRFKPHVSMDELGGRYQPVKDLKGEPWESASGRDARLVQKHLTKLQQILLGTKAAVTGRTAKMAKVVRELAAAMAQFHPQLGLHYDAAS